MQYLLLLIPFLLNSQINNLDDSELSFVNLEANSIQFFNETSNLDNFYAKLDSLLKTKKGKVRILQIGGSHIQAEIWPDQLRKNFLFLSKENELNGGRGFVFPFKIAETWNPKNHQISYSGKWEAYRNSMKKHQATWGVSGITVTTKDSVSRLDIGYKHDSLTSYTFDRLKIFHEIGESSFDVNLISENPSDKTINNEMGYTEFRFNTTDSISIVFNKTNEKQDHFTLYGLSFENDDPGIVYISVGVNGAKTSSFLRNELFVSQLESIKPDLVIFCLGINDAYNIKFCDTCYQENYDELVEWVKQVNPKTDLLFVTNNDSYYKQKYANTNVFKAREVMVNLAKKYHAGLWDLFEVMGGLDSVKKWEEEGYAKKDKIHFTNKGYQLVGDLMFVALMKQYNNYIKKED